jgi:pimeloyl-ACP methyl ester carboxylesterase
MRIKTHELGTGERIAVLIHGIMASRETWCRVAPALVARGYRVVMPDLRGHGDSPRADAYSAELFAADLVDTLPRGADLALGHSLGGLALSLAVGELRPARAVYSDPAWRLGRGPGPEPFREAARTFSEAGIRAAAPRWTDEDVAAEVESLRRWDVASADWLADASDAVPERPVVPSLVQAAGDGLLVPPDFAADLRGRGFAVRTVAGTGHCVHRDDLNGFLSSLEGWI